LNYIAKFNAFFTRTVPGRFGTGCVIVPNRADVAVYKREEKITETFINRLATNSSTLNSLTAGTSSLGSSTVRSDAGLLS
jgi:hypothetical protein